MKLLEMKTLGGEGRMDVGGECQFWREKRESNGKNEKDNGGFEEERL